MDDDPDYGIPITLEGGLSAPHQLWRLTNKSDSCEREMTDVQTFFDPCWCVSLGQAVPFRW